MQACIEPADGVHGRTADQRRGLGDAIRAIKQIVNIRYLTVQANRRAPLIQYGGFSESNVCLVLLKRSDERAQRARHQDVIRVQPGHKR